MIVYTAGYGNNRTPEQLASRAEALNASVLDIRLVPISMRRPYWSSWNLIKVFAENYIPFSWWGNENYLPRDRPYGMKIRNFQAGLRVFQSFKFVNDGRNVILLCACAREESCHRAVIAELLRDLGYTVEPMKWDAETPSLLEGE